MFFCISIRSYSLCLPDLSFITPLSQMVKSPAAIAAKKKEAAAAATPSGKKMPKTPKTAEKKKDVTAAAATASPAGKENAPASNGKSPAAASPGVVDRYAELEKKKSAFSSLSAEAKVLAAAAPPLKENAVPVGMRRTDKKNRERYSDGIAVEPVALHANGDRTKEQAVAKKEAKAPEMSVREMKAELAKKAAKKNGKEPESAKKNEKRRLQESDEDEEAGAHEGSFIMKRMQQLANAAMEKEITQKKHSKRARQSTPSDSETEENSLALVASRKGTPHPAKKSRLSSGVTVEKPHFDVDELPYTVEEPGDDGSVSGKGGRLSKKKRHYASQDFSAFEREMAERDPYNEEEDGDFEGESEDDDEELTDEEYEEVLTDDMSGEEMEDEEVDDASDEDEEVTDEELMSSDVDEEQMAAIRPEDILRTVTFDEDDDEEPESDDDDEEEEEDEDEEEEEEHGGCEMANGGCCDDSDCDENGEHGSDDEEFTSDSSSHVSDDSYGEAFVDDEMDSKSVTMARAVSATGKGKKKGAKAAAAAAGPGIDFATFPFKDADSSVSASKALDWLLSPCDVQTFFEDFFQTTSLVVQRGDANYYGNLFSSGAMSTLLRENSLEYGVNVNVALYENGVRTTHNGTGRAYPLAIGDAIRSGCSVQLTNPQTYSREIWYLCDTLQEVFHCFVGANTYITPAGASGFAPHWDEIDAFLLQVEGRKYWRVWSPESPDAELPLESSGNFTEADMAGRKPAYEGWLEQGDMLYIPRGFIHQARTDASVHSLHVTISAGRQWTFSNLLQKLLPAAMEAFTADRSKLRRQLPPGLLDMTGVAELEVYPMEEAGESKLISPLDRHMSKFRFFVGDMRESGVDLMAREFMRTALPPALTAEEKQLSAWGNAGADLFSEKGAARITPASEVRFMRRHGQRLLFESPESPFVVHRMANARQYEGAEERTFSLTVEEEPAFADLLSAYPDWTTVKDLKMKKKAKIAFLTKLFNHGLIMVRSA